MPTTTFTVNANNQDGSATITSTLGTSTFIRSIQSPFNAATSQYFGFEKSRVWLRFNGITIPQGTSITSATLRVYGTLPFAVGTANVAVYVDGRQSPPVPTLAAQVLTPTSLVATTTNPTLLFTNTATPTNKANHTLKTTNVTSLVQSLVNTYNYSSGVMMVYLASGPPAAVYAKEAGNTKQAELVVNYVLAALNLADKTTVEFV